MSPARKIPLAERLQRLTVRQESGCLVWRGSRDRAGYGRLEIAGKGYFAHRVAWEVASERPIPEGLHILHSCDNPPCCEPSHLSLGTQRENQRDRVERWRPARDERFTDDDVREMRRLAAEGVLHRDIAAKFLVNVQFVSAVVRGLPFRDEVAS